MLLDELVNKELTYLSGDTFCVSFRTQELRELDVTLVFAFAVLFCCFLLCFVLVFFLIAVVTVTVGAKH